MLVLLAWLSFNRILPAENTMHALREKHETRRAT